MAAVLQRLERFHLIKQGKGQGRMVKEEKCALPPCPGLLENKELSSLSVADLAFILFNIN